MNSRASRRRWNCARTLRAARCCCACGGAVAGALIATAAEFVTGCVVNLWLGWGVWDYSALPGNLLGQICPQFTLLWVGIAAVAVVLDDVIRWRFFGEERPHYRLCRTRS